MRKSFIIPYLSLLYIHHRRFLHRHPRKLSMSLHLLPWCAQLPHQLSSASLVSSLWSSRWSTESWLQSRNLRSVQSPRIPCVCQERRLEGERLPSSIRLQSMKQLFEVQERGSGLGRRSACHRTGIKQRLVSKQIKPWRLPILLMWKGRALCLLWRIALSWLLLRVKGWTKL